MLMLNGQLPDAQRYRRRRQFAARRQAYGFKPAHRLSDASRSTALIIARDSEIPCEQFLESESENSVRRIIGCTPKRYRRRYWPAQPCRVPLAFKRKDSSCRRRIDLLDPIVGFEKSDLPNVIERIEELVSQNVYERRWSLRGPSEGASVFDQDVRRVAHSQADKALKVSDRHPWADFKSEMIVQRDIADPASALNRRFVFMISGPEELQHVVVNVEATIVVDQLRAKHKGFLLGSRNCLSRDEFCSGNTTTSDSRFQKCEPICGHLDLPLLLGLVSNSSPFAGLLVLGRRLRRCFGKGLAPVPLDVVKSLFVKPACLREERQ